MEKSSRKELSDGTIEYRNSKGELHREDGPAIEFADGSKQWYLNGELHRLDGPAIEYVDGFKAWYVNGKSHREDGPAVVWPRGYKQWYLDNQRLTEEEFNKRMNINKSNDTISKTFDQDFTYESKLYTSINEFKQHLKTNK